MALAKEADLKTEAFDYIPIIDLTNARSHDPEVRKALADKIKLACMEVGFFYVSNHGIPTEVLDDVLSAMKEFFALPIEEKMEIENKKTPNFKGYSPLLSGNNDPNNSGDLQEGFEFGYEPIDTSKADRGDGGYMGANVWPSSLPSFRPRALKYYHEAVALGKTLFPLFALALGLPENFFEDKTERSAALMRLLFYPPQTGPVDDRVIGIGAHTDWECFTILWQEPGIQALQVLNSEKKWIDAPPTPGTFVVNLGDQFARWTNDVFKSTVHRAINRSGVQRYSIPLFFGTDYEVKLESLLVTGGDAETFEQPIPGCVSEDRPAKYEVITAGEYVKTKLKETYGH